MLDTRLLSESILFNIYMRARGFPRILLPAPAAA